MSRRTHELKTIPAYFEQVWSGAKTFEIRIDDRGYQAGDRVILREYDLRNYSGREVRAVIGCVIASTPDQGQRRGFRGNGFVVFSLTEVERVEPLEEVVSEEPRSVTPADLARSSQAAIASGQRLMEAARKAGVR